MHHLNILNTCTHIVIIKFADNEGSETKKKHLRPRGYVKYVYSNEDSIPFDQLTLMNFYTKPPSALINALCGTALK